MKNLLLLLAVLCAGCADGIDRLHRMRDDSSPSVQLAKYGQTCQSIGHVPGTPGYRRCVAQLGNGSSGDAPGAAATTDEPKIEETVRER
jgi:hypothetical protein